MKLLGPLIFGIIMAAIQSGLNVLFGWNLVQPEFFIGGVIGWTLVTQL